MSEWAAKRFWKAASVVEVDDGFGVVLDERPLRTPAKQALVLPTASLAEKIAAEWEAVAEVIDPNAMPWTRSANSAIDKIIQQRKEVEAHLISYAETDLTCYRAVGPATLIARQAATWDPLLDWASETYDVSFNVTTGVMPVAQPAATATALAQAMDEMTVFELTGFHDLVTLSGSYVIALAVIAARDSRDLLWRASRIDEDFQIEQWGEDEEAAEEATLRQLAFLHAADFFQHAKKTGRTNELRL